MKGIKLFCIGLLTFSLGLLASRIMDNTAVTYFFTGFGTGIVIVGSIKMIVEKYHKKYC